MRSFRLADVIIIFGLSITALFVWNYVPQKYQPLQKIHPAAFIPAEMKGWKSITHDTKDFKDKWDSINELFVRTYYRPDGEYVNLILEYSSDMRKNFSLHFPENCHRSHGNHVEFLPALATNFSPTKARQAKLLYIYGIPNSPVMYDSLIAYWITIDKKHFYQTVLIKLDQMLSGMINKPKQGFLVRVDYANKLDYDDQSISRGKEIINHFLSDLYNNLKLEDQERLFGK